MKVFIFLTAFLLLSAGSNANILESIKNGLGKVGDFFKDTFNDAKEIGKQVLNQAVNGGKELLSQTGQALIGSILQNLQSAVGKRSLDVQKLVNSIKNGIEKAKSVMDNAKSMLQGAYEVALEKLKAVADKVSNLDFICSLKNGADELEKMIDGAVDTHTRVARDVVGATGEWLLKLLGNGAEESVLGLAKRDLGKQKRILDALANIGKAIGDFFKPHVDNIIEGVKQMGNSLKDAAGNALESIKGHVNTLGEKLAGHVDELKNHGEQILGHGANALNALKDAVGDIINQTVKNVGENIGGIIDTGKDAGKVIGEHING